MPRSGPFCQAMSWQKNLGSLEEVASGSTARGGSRTQASVSGPWHRAPVAKLWDSNARGPRTGDTEIASLGVGDGHSMHSSRERTKSPYILSEFARPGNPVFLPRAARKARGNLAPRNR